MRSGLESLNKHEKSEKAVILSFSLSLLKKWHNKKICTNKPNS